MIQTCIFISLRLFRKTYNNQLPPNDSMICDVCPDGQGMLRKGRNEVFALQQKGCHTMRDSTSAAAEAGSRLWGAPGAPFRRFPPRLFRCFGGFPGQFRIHTSRLVSYSRSSCGSGPHQAHETQKLLSLQILPRINQRKGGTFQEAVTLLNV